MKLHGDHWSIEWGVAGPPVAFGSEFSSTMVGRSYVELLIRGRAIDLSDEDLGPLHDAIRHKDRRRCNDLVEEFAAKAKGQR